MSPEMADAMLEAARLERDSLRMKVLQYERDLTEVREGWAQAERTAGRGLAVLGGLFEKLQTESEAARHQHEHASRAAHKEIADAWQEVTALNERLHAAETRLGGLYEEFERNGVVPRTQYDEALASKAQQEAAHARSLEGFEAALALASSENAALRKENAALQSVSLVADLRKAMNEIARHVGTIKVNDIDGRSSATVARLDAIIEMALKWAEQTR